MRNKEEEHIVKVENSKNKYQSKLILYENEITRLKLEIKKLHDNIEMKFLFYDTTTAQIFVGQTS